MSSDLNFLAANSEVANIMRTHDWSTSPLGAPAAWPQALQTVVSLVLHAKTPMYIAWGPELCMLYNDAYIDILGNNHPRALGQPFPLMRPELWKDLAPLYQKTFAGEPQHAEDMLLTLRRKGFDEQTWFSFSYTPIYEGDKVAGLFCSLFETTHRVLAEQRRHEENKRLQQLFEQAPGVMAVQKGPDHVFEFANSTYLQVVGHRDIIGKPTREVFPELEGQGVFELLDQVYATGKPYRGYAYPTAFQRGPDGELEELFFDFVYQPIRDESGKVIGIFTEGFDVTESVRATAALRESENRLQQLADTIPQLAWMADASGNIHWYNQRWCEYTGKTLEQMQGTGWQEVHDADALPEILNRWRRSVAAGEPFEMTFPLRGKDGEFRPFFTLVAPLKDSSGKIVQWFGTNTDVSTLKKTQDALRKTEMWLEEGLTAGRMVVWEWDLHSNEVKYSANSHDILGYGSGDISQEWRHVHPDDIQRVRHAVDRAIAERSAFQHLSRRVRPDNGQIIWIDQRGKAILDDDGNLVSIRGINVDVSERAKAEAELKDANRRKDEFLAMLAHELRNPLAPINTAAQLLQLSVHNEKVVRQASEIISRQVRHMTELVDDLLDVSRVTRGLVQLEKETLDVKSVVANAIEQVRPLIEVRRHQLQLHMHAESVHVVGDRTRLTQVISNLLNNAAKYTPQGGRIALQVDVQESTVIIAVSDNGIGIEAALQPHVFELFTQAERTPDRSQGGLGIGLSLVKSIVNLHGGQVEVHSDGPGRGSKFTVMLPAVERHAPGNNAEHTEAVLAAGKALHVMIVDDNVDAAHSLAALLKTAGHEVTVKENATGALEHARQYPPEAFILDIGLPDMDGYELVRHLRNRQETGKALFIALTGYGQTHDRVLSKTAGFDHHLVKPVDMQDLTNILHRMN